MPKIKMQTELDVPDDVFERSVENAIKNNPDYVLVVRCKDCKWYAPNNDGRWLGCAIDTSHPADEPKPYDFCSYGERRNNDG